MKRSISVKRAAKVSTGNYENTDVSVELYAELDDDVQYETSFKILCSEADRLLKIKIDEIELGKNAAKSKASRFGV